MWSTILGHKRQIAQLRKALETKRLPHAYLFSGLSGTGKKLVAEAFVSAIFCAKDPDPCGTCVPCIKIKNRSHPDVFFIEPRTEKILIEQMRELQHDLQFHPLEGDAKVAVIDDADVMTEAAANSLLKILEEPPQKTHFILITAFPHRLLPTIRSRCQQIVFSPLASDDVANYLMEQKGLDEKQAGRIARISQGSIGSVAGMEPEFIEGVMESLKNLFGRANSADIISTAEGWSKDLERPHLILDLMVSFYRDILYFRATNSDSGMIHKELTSTLKGRPTPRIEADLRAIAGARNAIQTSANKQLLFEQLLFTLTT
jgi:DNA polymerase-3 subunit delta'